MEAIYYHEDLQDLNTSLKELFSETQSFMILERVDEFVFDRYRPIADHLAWEKGCIFDTSGELKWKLFGKKVHAVYIGSQTPSEMKKGEDVKFDSLNPKEEEWFLWGKIVEQKDMKYFERYTGSRIYIEQRIPHIFNYPVKGAPDMVKLLIRKYVDSRGDAQFLRYVDLVAEGGN